MRKNSFLLLFIILSVAAALRADAQSAENYVLVPGYSFLLPLEQRLPLSIQWIDDKGMTHLGVIYHGKDWQTQQPEWFINGMPAASAPATLGKLNVDLGFEKAVYQAPSNLPPGNPVAISVRFYPDSLAKAKMLLVCNVTLVDPGKRWYVSYSFSNSHASNDESGGKKSVATGQCNGHAELLIAGNAPDKDGHITIDTENDSIVEFASGGVMSERSDIITYKIGGGVESRELRTGRGEVTHERRGIQVEYDPSPGGYRGIAGATLIYDVGGMAETWQDGKHTKEQDKVQRNFSIGNDGQVVKKTANGFVVDFTVSKDTTYKDAIGGTHHVVSHTDYHATVAWKRPPGGPVAAKKE
jgi:hypothetical protein